MKTGRTLISCAAILAIASSAAIAGPGEKGARTKPLLKGPPPTTPTASADLGDFTDNFDSYTAGQGLIGNGGWEAWYTTPGSDGLVDDARSLSPRNSLKFVLGTDVVQRVAITSGVWELTIQTYVPASAPPGDGAMIIMLNQYAGPDNWSIQLAMNENFFSASQPVPHMIESQWDGAVLPLILDQWVEVKAVIDLDNDVVNTFYGGTPLGVNLSWIAGTSGGGGLPQIAALDLWTSSSFLPPTIWFDDISLVELGACPCPCEFDTSTGPGVCDIIDFVTFAGLFAAQDPCACDLDISTGQGVCDIIDFVTFAGLFAVAGCP